MTAPTGRTDVPSAAPAQAATATAEAATATEAAATVPERLGRIARKAWRGRAGEPAWARPALLGLLLGTLVLYLYDLGASGYANSFYSAAVQAGSQSWKAFFFGSSDAANSITVDKPPAALWPMALSVRLFGLGSWQILVPEALMGVGTVALLHASVRRRFGPGAALLAGAVLAVTPVAALMFRFNNPDAMLALLMVASVCCVQRALEGARTSWLVGAGALLGLAFLTKTLQAWLIVPVLAAVYAACAPARLRRRLLQLLAAGGAMVLAGGWWVAVVELWPASSRPYIGGSQDNSFLSLTFGYNGFGRITGNETGSVGGGRGPGGGGGGGGMWGRTGIGRLFGSDMGGQIAWLLPAAFALLLAGLWLTRRGRRTDAERAAFLLWGGSLLATFVTFSFMSGIFHQYYNIALAPYVAAVVAMGAAMLWRRRREAVPAAVLGSTVAGTGATAYVLLGRSPDWHPWLRWAVLLAAAGAAVLLLALPYARSAALGRGAAVLGLAAALGGPVAYTLQTVGTPHSGSIVTAGPAVAPGGFPGGGRAFPGAAQGGGGPGAAPGAPGGRATPGQGFPGGGRNAQGLPGFPGGGAELPGARGGGGQGGGMGGGMGGLLNGAQVGAELKALLTADADSYTWAAATIGSQNQASYQLATGKPVMAIGGFNGSDPSPTLARFKEYVAEGRIHYFVAGGGMGRSTGGSDAPSRITSWVEATFTAKTVGSTTVYDLS
jgi:4-amino-4-deoxy-L-arabinose transferase-like glycosyltransferase